MKRFRNTPILCAVIILAGLAAVALGVTTTVAIYTSALTGTTLTRTNIGPGTTYDFLNTGREMLIVENESDTTTATLTIVTGATMSDLAVADQAVTVVPNAILAIGGLPPSTFNPTGNLQLTVATTTCTLMVVKFKSN